MEVETSLEPRAAVEGVLADPGQRTRLVAYARARFAIDSDSAEDLLQETAVEVLRQKSLVRSPRGFIFTVFHARCCRFVGLQQSRRRVFDTGDRALPEKMPHTAVNEKVESRLSVEQALEELSPACRKVLLAYYVEGKSLRETATSMTLAYSGVWKTISRCLKKLRLCLA